MCPILGTISGKLRGLRDGGRFHLCQRMLRRGDDYQFVAMNQYDRQARIGHGKGNHAEVYRVVDHRFQNFGVVCALDVHAHIRMLLFELGKNLGQNVQAGAFVGADDDFSARHAFGFGDAGQHGFARCHRLFGKLLEKFS